MSGPTFEDWQKLLEKEGRGKKLEDFTWNSPEQIRIKPLYTEDDLKGLNRLNSFPGIDPFVRGPRSFSGNL